MKSESNRPITIEDLLRLKRAERPPTEFWATFDRELRAKQLSALVAKRPWWQSMPSVFSRLVRYRIPLGAGAIAVLTFVSLSDKEAPSRVTLENSAEPAVQVATAIVAATDEVVAPANAAIVSSSSIAVVQSEDVPAIAQPLERGAPATLRTLPVGGVSIAADIEQHSPAARRTAANLAVMQAAERSASRSLLAAPSGFEDRAMPSRVPVEPLQQMTPPSDSRRARLLTAMVSMASLESSMRTTERAANRIAHERLYDDQMSRFDARGDRLQVKF